MGLFSILLTASLAKADVCTLPVGYPFASTSPDTLSAAMAMNGFYDSVINGPNGLVAIPFMGTEKVPPYSKSLFGAQLWDNQEWKTLTIDNTSQLTSWNNEPKFAFLGNKFYAFITASHAGNVSGVWMYSQKPDGSFNPALLIPGLSNIGADIEDVYAAPALNKIAALSWKFSQTFYTEISTVLGGKIQTNPVLIASTPAPGRPYAVGIMSTGTPWILMLNKQGADSELYVLTKNPRGQWQKSYTIAQERTGSIMNPIAVQTPDANRPRILFSWTHNYAEAGKLTASTFTRFLELPTAGTSGNLTAAIELKKFTEVTTSNARTTNAAFRADGLTGEIVLHDGENQKSYVAAIDGELVRSLVPFHPEKIFFTRPSLFFNPCGQGLIESRGLINKTDPQKIFVEKLPTATVIQPGPIPPQFE